jgi:hypothetical protein
MTMTTKEKDELWRLLNQFPADFDDAFLGKPLTATAAQMQAQQDAATKQAVMDAMKGNWMDRDKWLDELNQFTLHEVYPKAIQDDFSVRGHTYDPSYLRGRACPMCGITSIGSNNQCDTCYQVRCGVRPDMPTLYPTLTRRGTIVLLTLPAATPPNLVLMLNNSVPLRRIDDYRCEFPYTKYDVVENLLVGYFGRINEEDETADPNAPQTLFIEYIGLCHSHSDSRQQKSVVCRTCRGSGINTHIPMGMSRYGSTNCYTCKGNGRIVEVSNASYASGWYQGGWNVRFPKAVLKAYFGEPAAAFDGDFHRALLQAPEIAKRYKQLARQFHPDVKGGSVKMFQKLADAYRALKDPQLRKRYQAGLAFQQLESTKKDAVTFKVPISCGDAIVRGTWEAVQQHHDDSYWGGKYVPEHFETGQQRLLVSEIISFNERVDAQGRVMVATWDGGNVTGGWKARGQDKPFKVEWITKYEVDFDVAI